MKTGVCILMNLRLASTLAEAWEASRRSVSVRYAINQKAVSVIESAVVRVEPGVSPVVAGDSTVAPVLINVWMVDTQPAFVAAVAKALEQTDDLVLGGYFIHPDDVLLGGTCAKPPGVILMDVDEFGSVGIQAVRQFRRVFPKVLMVVLTDSVEEQLICAAVCAGVSGYLLKSSPMASISASIREVASGGAALTPLIARSVLEVVRRLSGAQLDHGLTSRELEILDLMGQGLLMKEIAQKLTVSYHTVDAHLRNIYGKLGVRSRTEAVVKALRQGII
jgi:DNA-binding NarL/FixJ family response regulator